MAYIFYDRKTKKLIDSNKWIADDLHEFLCWSDNGIDIDEIKSRMSISPEKEYDELLYMLMENSRPEMNNWIRKRLRYLEGLIARSND